MVRALGLVVLIVAACSGSGGGHTVRPPPPPIDAAVAVVAEPVTVRECDDLIAHAVALAGAGRGSAAPTPVELDAVAASLRADLGARCAGLPREAYRCAIAAPTLADLAACEH